MLVIKNAELFSPKPCGLCDLVVVNEKIVAVHDAGAVDVAALTALDAAPTVIDAKGARVIPGMIDRHVHFNGAGGEGGPLYRTPPLQLSSFIKAGVTSAVGLLGTDGAGRSLMDLLQKARQLDAEGISTWIYTGSYAVPTVTLTGSVQGDLVLIDKVIGLKIAVSDQRGSHPTVEELRRAISDARLGGVIAGKCGTVCVHTGIEKSNLDHLMQALEGTEIPPSQLAPTHISRDESLLSSAAAVGKIGGNLDITTTPESMTNPKSKKVSTRRALRMLLDAGVPPERITLSSDGNGSMPRWKDGKVVGMGIGPITAMLQSVLELWDEFGPELVLGLACANPADQLALAHKGRLEPGKDADLLVLEDGVLRHVIAKGQVLMQDGAVVKKGTFEE
jgi:beta-aspartyl-dipeptidase (metallo-type)